MGRGTREALTAAVTRSGANGGPGRATRCEVRDLLGEGHDESLVGRIAGTGDDEFVIEGGNTMMIQGLAEIASVTPARDLGYTVRFRDGSAAFVDPRTWRVGFDSGADFEPYQLHGALAMALARHHADNTADQQVARLSDAYADYYESGPTQATLANLAAAAEAIIKRDADDGITINPPSVKSWFQRQNRDFAPIAEDGFSARAALKRRGQEFAAVMNGFEADGVSELNALRAAAFGVDTRGKPLQPSPEEIEAFKQAAIELGGTEYEVTDANGESVDGPDGQPQIANTRIPRVPHWKMGDQERMMVINWAHFDSQGGRATFIAGPHGTGKNVFVRKLAEIHQAPLTEFTLGEGVSLQALIGDTGMKSETILNPDGSIHSQVPVTKEQEGPLLRALKKPGFIVLNEAEDIQEMMLALNTAMGDRVGDTSGRTINTNTSEGEEAEHIVDPDCRIFVTWNPGHEDRAPKESTMDRGLTLHMKRGTPAQEAPKYTQMVEDAMHFQNAQPAFKQLQLSEPALDSKGKPIYVNKAGEEVKAKVNAQGQAIYTDANSKQHLAEPKIIHHTEVIANFAEKLQRAASTDANTFRREVGPRTMARFAGTLLLEAAKVSNQSPIDVALLQLRGLLPGYPAMDDQEAMNHLKQQASDYFPDLISFSRLGYELIQKEKVAAKKSTRKPKQSAASGK
jgi:MoxR-like ATPase